MRIGLTQEAEQFVKWLDVRAHEFGQGGASG
jgi:hypothetical protein